MKFKTPMEYLGVKQVEKKDGSGSYFMAKLMDSEAEIYEFYVPGTNHTLINDLKQLSRKFYVEAVLNVGAFKGKPQLDLSGVKQTDKQIF